MNLRRRRPAPTLPQPTPDLLAYATLLDERDSARAYAQRVEEENAFLFTVLREVRGLLDGVPTTEELTEVIDQALAAVQP